MSRGDPCGRPCWGSMISLPRGGTAAGKGDKNHQSRQRNSQRDPGERIPGAVTCERGEESCDGDEGEGQRRSKDLPERSQGRSFARSHVSAEFVCGACA